MRTVRAAVFIVTLALVVLVFPWLWGRDAVSAWLLVARRRQVWR